MMLTRGWRSPMSLARLRALECLVPLAALLLGGCGNVSTAPLTADVKELARQSLATLDGDLSVSGLKQPVEIVRDQWGIPHIYAQNIDDLFFAQGYVMAQD